MRFRCLSGCAAFVLITTFIAACAPVVPPTNVKPKHPDYLFPVVPQNFTNTRAAASHNEAWLFLQAGDMLNAHRRFLAALEKMPNFYPAEAGLGYVRLTRGQYDEAVRHFEEAIESDANYVSALVGMGEALLRSGKSAAALESYESALSVDGGLARISRRVELLRFDRMQEEVVRARSAATTGRYKEARTAYERAITESPESTFLYVELGRVVLEEGGLNDALGLALKATELDRNDNEAISLEADIREAMGDFEKAEELLRNLYALNPSEETSKRLERLQAHIELETLPTEYREIQETSQISRAQLAALLGVRFATLFKEGEQARTVIITDTREHWANRWVLSVTSADVMDVNVNYTFQPEALVDRGELGEIIGRIIDLIAPDLDVRKHKRGELPAFTDIGPGHLRYPAAFRAVAAGILPVLGGNTFQPTRPVSGVEAVAAIERLQKIEDEG